MADESVAPAPPLRLAPVARLLWPWAAFLAMLAWAWRVKDLFNNVPAYGDALEVLWGLEWYAQSLAHGRNPLYFSGVFAPLGWQVATLAHGPAFFLALMPLYALGGAAFAYNGAALGANVLAFAGMYKAAKLWLSPIASTVAALAFTFWGYRWLRNAGHLHTLVATALLPFQVWAWEQARRKPARRLRWFVISGVFWAVSMAASLYALWHGLVLLLSWSLAGVAARQVEWKTCAKGLLIAGLTALLLGSPILWLFWRSMSASQTRFFSLETLVGWAASLNSLPIPSLGHPWLRGIARMLDRGPINEAEVANFGLTLSSAALVGVLAARADRRLWPFIACAAAGLVLALGPVVKLNGNVQAVSWLKPLDETVWAVGHRLKPGLFAQAQPPGNLSEAIPLPDMLLAVLVPFWEGARVTSRFAFVAAVGVFPLMGYALARLKPLWLRVGLAAILLFEVLPSPTGSVPARPASHPAFDWLQAQDLAGNNIVDLASLQPNRLTLLFGGDILFATLYHHQATVAGVGSYLPAHFLTLQQWFDSVTHPLVSREFTALMRDFQVRYVVVHMESASGQPLVDEARSNAELSLVKCFDPPAGISPWPYPICILEVKPPVNARFNVIRDGGWSADEPWGTWVEGTQATARWVATAEAGQRLTIALLPVCWPNHWQHVTLSVNFVPVADHQWENCDAWQTQVVLPAAGLQVGWNSLTLQADWAQLPVDPVSGQIVDTRRLSVAVTQLLVGPP
jgi:hypothetical protein